MCFAQSCSFNTIKMRCRSSTDYFTKLLQELKTKYHFYLSQAPSVVQLSGAALCSDMNLLTNCSKRMWVSTNFAPWLCSEKTTFFLKSILSCEWNWGMLWWLASTWWSSEPLQWAVQIYQTASPRHPVPQWVLIGSILVFSSHWERAQGGKAGCVCKAADREHWMLLSLLQVNVYPLQFCRRIWVSRRFIHVKVIFLIASWSSRGFSLLRVQRIQGQLCRCFSLAGWAIPSSCSSQQGSAGRARGHRELCIRGRICITLNDRACLVLNIISKETASTEGQIDN